MYQAISLLCHVIRPNLQIMVHQTYVGLDLLGSCSGTIKSNFIISGTGVFDLKFYVLHVCLN